MRTILLLAPQAYLAELKHAIHGPLAHRVRRQVDSMIIRLSADDVSERGVEVDRLRQKTKSYQFLLSDYPEDIVSRCRTQAHHWLPPYFIVIFGVTARERARTLYQQLEQGTVSDIAIVLSQGDCSPSATRLECGILELRGTIKDRVVKDSLLGALLSFVIEDCAQQRIQFSSPGSVRPPPMLSATA